MALKVLLVSGQTLLREGVAHLLGVDGYAEVVSCAGSAQARAHTHAVFAAVVLDAGDGGHATETLAVLRKAGCAAPAVVLAVDDDHAFLQWLSAGARGFVPREAAISTLRSAIDDVCAGRLSMTDQQAELLAREFVRRSERDQGSARRPEVVTGREIDILRLLAVGLTNAGIARQLVLSENTVRAHIRSIVVKLDADNRVQAVARAMALGLLAAPDAVDADTRRPA